jgi:hypothetical protein
LNITHHAYPSYFSVAKDTVARKDAGLELCIRDSRGSLTVVSSQSYMRGQQVFDL